MAKQNNFGERFDNDILHFPIENPILTEFSIKFNIFVSPDTDLAKYNKWH